MENENIRENENLNLEETETENEVMPEEISAEPVEETEVIAGDKHTEMYKVCCVCYKISLSNRYI